MTWTMADSPDYLEPPSLRMFEFSYSGSPETEIRHIAIDLPRAWARPHASAAVSFRHSGELGWGAELVGDGRQHLLGFPWYDHVDKMLLAPGRELPPAIESGAWDDIEQSWWASIRVAAGDVYIAETFDDIAAVDDPEKIVQGRPGAVVVGTVEIFWNCLSKPSYDAAWREAIERVRRGLPRSD
jgi:hypothetical protein